MCPFISAGPATFDFTGISRSADKASRIKDMPVQRERGKEEVEKSGERERGAAHTTNLFTLGQHRRRSTFSEVDHFCCAAHRMCVVRVWVLESECELVSVCLLVCVWVSVHKCVRKDISLWQHCCFYCCAWATFLNRPRGSKPVFGRGKGRGGVLNIFATFRNN